MSLRIYRTMLTPEHLGQAVELWFKRRGFETQRLRDETGVVVQARKGGTWAQVAGMSAAFTVHLRPREEGVEVSTQITRWLDKAAAGAAGVLIFSPLMLTAGWGIYQQNKLKEELLTFLEYYVAEVGS
ncbi:hypothetical protein Adeg_1583 [Ammonifex degensii KC4]|uniref:Uncharacterized protein n=1 Tax=Ammonifex degensii (strain DSM 10501 / KC4) TaxID=429009 RepID=C9R8P9_AMMDK|nr:hypothetical protein [Ammonifex degensii]ACX52678.1 hypothetical protein Adeg_1583 [Ammonifex degensii KC4]